MSTSFIKISGPDAEKFLQGQITCDVTQLNKITANLAAHCNSKGRIVSLFWIWKQEQDFYLALSDDLLPIALKNLKKYGIFFKGLKIETVSQPPFIPENVKQSRLDNIRQGIPTLYAATSEFFLPHDLNLPQLGAVSFTKGCYTGQEIVARMENLGTPKQHLYKLKFELDAAPLPGTKLFLETNLESEIGRIVDAVAVDTHVEALAVIKDRVVSQIQLLKILIEGREIIEVEMSK
jgi:folate-binding protein YgfZ